MRLLLDTHTFLWYYSGSSELSETAKSYIDDTDNEFWVSIASLWEISIKHRIGKLNLNKPLDVFCDDVVKKGFIFLPIEIPHIIQAAQFPFHNRDPFDRLIASQAIIEKLELITKDDVMDLYLEKATVKTIW